MHNNVELAIADKNYGEIQACQIVNQEQYIKINSEAYSHSHPLYASLCCYKKVPFKDISSKDELLDFIRKVNEGDKAFQTENFRLCKDIDLEGTVISSCGVSLDDCYTGIFDGQGHTVSNFKIESEDQQFAGFFAYLSESVIYNLNLENFTGCNGEAGIFATSIEDCVIQHCSSQGALLVGENGGVILDCTLRV